LTILTKRTFLKIAFPPKNPNVFVEEMTKFVEKGIKKILETLVLPP
jgi:hypothetical protein